jgi:outer membrane protein OmpA-like peptidoglycan-associated protein
MRTMSTLAAAGLLFAALPVAAHAQWYAGADAGATALEKSSVTAGANHDTSYNFGPVVLGEVGYDFGGPKAELEIGDRDNTVHRVGGVSGGGRTNAFSVMTNGIYDFLPTSRWHPFLGAGIGVARVVSNDMQRNGSWAYSGDNWAFAYQGMAGVGYDLTRDWMLKAQYRYFATADYNVAGAGGTSGHAEYHSHAVLVGLTYSFNPPPAPPPPVEVAAPVMPPAPPAKPAPVIQKNYMVFFDFDKSTITPQAAQIITEAAAASTQSGATKINVTGYTDRAGTVKYNIGLSWRRAKAVRAALVKRGVPNDEIVIQGRGESDPLVPTADGVREPQNRRVVIVLH